MPHKKIPRFRIFLSSLSRIFFFARCSLCFNIALFFLHLLFLVARVSRTRVCVFVKKSGKNKTIGLVGNSEDIPKMVERETLNTSKDLPTTSDIISTLQVYTCWKVISSVNLINAGAWTLRFFCYYVFVSIVSFICHVHAFRFVFSDSLCSTYEKRFFTRAFSMNSNLVV